MVLFIFLVGVVERIVMSSVQDSFDSYIFKTLYYGKVQIHTRRTRKVLRTHIPNSASTTINWLLIFISLTYSPPLLFQSKCQTHFVHGAYFLIGMCDICPYFIFYSIIFSSPLNPLTVSIRKAYFQLIISLCSITFIS